MKKLLCCLIFFILRLDAVSSSQAGWSGWSDWSGWGKGLCSGNQRVKTRSCTNPLPANNGEYCVGDSAVQQDGPIDGGYSEWSQWSTCEAPCGGSIVNRTRQCDNPPPQNSGRFCKGIDKEEKLECVLLCQDGKTDGGWTPWSPWSKCPQKCSSNGGALIRRSRQCVMPMPMFGGQMCPGNSTEEILACFHSCPINGGFSSWSTFSPCSKTCGSGVKQRNRTCSNPEPRGENARNCTGAYTDTKHCKLASCIGGINGKWSSWGVWSGCSELKYCNKGFKNRIRKCDNPAPNKGGDDCKGSSEEKQTCPTSKCLNHRPSAPPTLPVDKTDYLYRECAATIKYIATGAGGKTVPPEIYGHIKHSLRKFKSGYFAVQEEEKNTMKKYCFEPFPALTLKEATVIVPSYKGIGSIVNYDKPTDENMLIPGFSIRVLNTNLLPLKGWDFGINEVYQYNPGNGVKLYDVMFTYYVQDTHRSILAKGDFKLFNTNFKVQVFRNNTDGLSAMTGKTASITLKTVLDSFVPDNLNGVLGAAVKAFKSLGVWDIRFSPVEIAYDFWVKFRAVFRFTMTAYIKNIPLHVEILYVHNGWDRKIALGLVFDGESFGSALESIAGSGSTGKNIAKFFNTLGLQIEVGVAFCPWLFGAFPVSRTTRFRKEPLHSLYKENVPEGLTIVGQLSIPKDCKGSSFCEICKKILGPKVQFRVGGLVQRHYYKISGGFYNVRVTENFYFHKLELYIEVNKTASKKVVGFKAEVKVQVNDGSVVLDGIPQKSYLVLGGLIKHTMGKNDINGLLFMKGMWRNAFGLSWLNMGNIHVGITLTIGAPVPVTGFVFGAQLEFGHECLHDADYTNDGHCLRLKVYFGVGKPTYFYGEISALTIGKIVRMCGGKIGLPGPIAESGFPKGLMVQFNPSPKAIDLRNIGGPFIHQGFRLKGILNLMGYELKVSIIYSLREIMFDGELDPVNLGGHIILARNASHLHLGPKVLFHYKSSISLLKIPYFKMFFEGYAKVLGISAYAYVNITMEQMEIFVYGKLWNLIYADLYIAASYGIASIKNSHFYVRVFIDLTGLTDAIDKAKNSVDKAFKDAQKQLRGAIEKVKGAKQRCKEKMKLKCSNCYSLKCKQAESNCKGFLDKAGKWIGGIINKAGKWIKNTARKVKEGLAKVGKKIKKFFKGWRKRRALLSQRNEHFDIHIRNKRFISKLICEGIVGGGCRGVSALCYGSCKVVSHIGQGLCNVLDVAVGFLRLAEIACGWINSAIKFLLELFLIHKVFFEMGIGKRYNGFKVAAEIDMTLFGKRHYFGFEFDMKNKFQSIMSARDGGMDRYKEGVRQAHVGVLFNPYDRPNPFADFDLTGTFAIEALSTGTENRLGACISAPTQDNLAKMKLVGCNETDENQRWTYTLKGSLINLYSKKCLVFPNKEGGTVYQNDCEKDKDLQMHECDVNTRTLKLRRSKLCASTYRTSPTGPGIITHLGSLKCIQLSANNRLVLKTGCNRKDAVFKINQHGYLRFQARNYCVQPVGGRATAGVQLELVKTSEACHKFSFTKLGSLQHVDSRLCIQTVKKEMIPHERTALILGSRCEHIHVNNQPGQLADQQMTFAFVPLNNTLKMVKCVDGNDGVDVLQKFSIMYEELQSVCSKHSADLALNKVAAQSSVLHNGFPNRAVDGNYDFTWAKGSCMKTNVEKDPWWRVDLGREYIVTDVTIIVSDRANRFKEVQVHVGNKLTVKRNPVCHDRVRQADDGEALRLQCDPPIPGRFVGLQMYGKESLSMCEVIVASRLGGFVNPCEIENGGCDQICYSKCGRSTSCKCLPGYTLAYDGKSCIDIDECKVNNGGCRSDKKAYCVNYPGGFYCQCTKGAILKDNSLTECVDFNECGIKKGGCEQMCNNKEDGYMCACRKGFGRIPNNPYGCQNINECSTNNGNCSDLCHDFDGGFYCSCKPGYRLMEDQKTCEELLCPVLEKPFWGAVTPATCVERFQNIQKGSVCNFECAKGYELTSKIKKQKLTCGITGRWNSVSPSCHPVKCPILPRPRNGGLTPARCHTDVRHFNEFGQRCVAYCRDGYRLRGMRTKYCQADKTWSNSASAVECVKVIEPAYLNCPTDIDVVLPSHQNWITVDGILLEPQTNVNRSMINTEPVNIGPSYRFSVGSSLITFKAMRNNDLTAYCSFTVVVKDKTPPKMSHCPSDISKVGNGLSTIISWTEPKFSDNVGVKNVIKPSRSPGSVWQNGESLKLLYLASDGAGNIEKCIFKVSYKSTVCPALIASRVTSVDTVISNKQYNVHCLGQRTFFGSYDRFGSEVFCKDGDYYMDNDNVGVQTPECVGYIDSNTASSCDIGYVKFSYQGLFGDKQIYCAQCPTGRFYNETSKSCMLCEEGTYQDEQGQTYCETCPRGYSTDGKGAKDAKECVELCPPGYFSASGLNSIQIPCEPCAKGSYAYLNGSTECTICPNEATTLKTGAKDQSECLKRLSITRIEPGTSVTAPPSTDIKLACYFVGLPAPSVTWYKQNGAINARHTFENIYDHNTFKLIGLALLLNDVNRNEAGKYTCMVRNQLQRADKHVFVNIKN